KYNQRMANGYLCANLDEWSRFWGMPPTNSAQGKAVFEGGDMMEKMATAIHRMSPTNFRLTNSSPGKGKHDKDLGADVDKVGPGAPYERWRQSLEYQQWRTSTDKLMNAQ